VWETYVDVDQGLIKWVMFAGWTGITWTSGPSWHAAITWAQVLCAGCCVQPRVTASSPLLFGQPQVSLHLRCAVICTTPYSLTAYSWHPLYRAPTTD